MSWLKSIGGNLSVAQIKEWRGQVVNMTREIVIEGTREFYNGTLHFSAAQPHRFDHCGIRRR